MGMGIDGLASLRHHFVTLKRSELNRALAAAVDAAQAAGKLMRSNLASPKKVNVATAHDIKLELDVRCQKTIECILRRAFPNTSILGEEGIAGDPNSESRWVVDPIDGTVNFACGIPHACVSIALQVKSDKGDRRSHGRFPVTRHVSHVTLLGVVYDPFMDELWTATRGGPARLNGRPIHVSRRSRLAEAVVSVGLAKTGAEVEANLPYFIRMARSVRKIRIMGSAALGLAYVATGRFDAYIERGISLWDIAAGGLIVECAGGKFWSAHNPGDETFRMIASNGMLHSKLPIPK